MAEERPGGPWDLAMDQAHDVWQQDVKDHPVTERDRFDAGYMAGWNEVLSLFGISAESAMDRLRESQEKP